MLIAMKPPEAVAELIADADTGASRGALEDGGPQLSIPTIPASTHTLPDSITPQSLTELPAGILTTLFAVEHQAGRPPALFERHI
jgi:hypothetical protein